MCVGGGASLNVECVFPFRSDESFDGGRLNILPTKRYRLSRGPSEPDEEAQSNFTTGGAGETE